MSLMSNTYFQDETIPIYIILQYEGKLLKFPINPESLKISTPSNSDKVEIEGIGEVSIPKNVGLSTVTINSFFWRDLNLLPSSLYVKWLQNWQKSKKPANLIVTRFNYSMQVTCEKFDHEIRAGEEKDVYFSLEMVEYRSYGAKRLGSIVNKSLIKTIQDTINSIEVPILLEIPRVSRNQVNKPIFNSPYKTRLGDTLVSIARRLTGDSSKWKLLFNENKKLLGNKLTDNSELPTGTELIIPEEFSKDSTNTSFNGGIQ